MNNKCSNPACDKKLSGLIYTVGKLEFCCPECKDAVIKPETAENDRSTGGDWN